MLMTYCMTMGKSSSLWSWSLITEDKNKHTNPSKKVLVSTRRYLLFSYFKYRTSRYSFVYHSFSQGKKIVFSRGSFH